MFHAYTDYIQWNGTACQKEWLSSVLSSGPFDSHMADEAMSELIATVVSETQTLGPTVIPSYGVARSTPEGIRKWLAPGHNEPGEKWAGNPRASLPMSELQFYATFWIMNNGVPGNCEDVPSLREMQLLFEGKYYPQAWNWRDTYIVH